MSDNFLKIQRAYLKELYDHLPQEMEQLLPGKGYLLIQGVWGALRDQARWHNTERRGDHRAERYSHRALCAKCA